MAMPWPTFGVKVLSWYGHDSVMVMQRPACGCEAFVKGLITVTSKVLGSAHSPEYLGRHSTLVITLPYI